MKRARSLPNITLAPPVVDDAAPATALQGDSLPAAADSGTVARARKLPRPNGTSGINRATFSVAEIPSDARTARSQAIAKSLQSWIEVAPVDAQNFRTNAAAKIMEAFNDDSKTLILMSMGINSLPACLHHLHALENLHLSSNPLTTLPLLPKFLKNLQAQRCHLATLPPLPETLLNLGVFNNNLSIIAKLPARLEFLDVSMNPLLQPLPDLPATLQQLIACGSRLTVLPFLPQYLEGLHVTSNQLKTLPVLPNALEHLDVNGNDLKVLPALPDNLQVLDVGNNSLSTLPVLPAGLYDLIALNNPLQTLPRLPDSLLTIAIDPEVMVEHLENLEHQMMALEKAMENPQSRPLAVVPTGTNHLENLPRELIEKVITKFLPGSADAVRLSATNRFLHAVAQERLGLDNQFRHLSKQHALLIECNQAAS